MLGCLALFLWGMNLMSSSLQRFAGKGLRSFIEKMTSNTGKCLFTGFLVTVLVQSSTATTLMLVSFVNAGLMTLKSAIGVIMGASVETYVLEQQSLTVLKSGNLLLSLSAVLSELNVNTKAL